MAPKIIRGKIENGKIIPETPFSKTIEKKMVQIVVFPIQNNGKEGEHSDRFLGILKGRFEDPLAYQKKMRKEWNRD